MSDTSRSVSKSHYWRFAYNTLAFLSRDNDHVDSAHSQPGSSELEIVAGEGPRQDEDFDEELPLGAVDVSIDAVCGMFCHLRWC